MFSFPLFERLKAEAPEFEQLTAFQAGGVRVSVRRPGRGRRRAPAPVRIRHRQLLHDASASAPSAAACFTAEDDTPASPPVVVLSHHVVGSDLRRRPSVVGPTLVIEGHPFTVVGVAPPGFFGETLRGDPPDLWIPLQQEPLITGDNSLLRQPVSAWLRVIGRLKPGATIDGMAPRLTGVLRQWMQHDSGYPANWMPDVERLLPKQTIAIVPAGAGVGVMKEQYASSLQMLLAVCGLVLLIACANVANLLLARVGRAADADGRAAGDRRVAPADRHAGARREHPARHRRRHRRAGRRDGRGAAAALARVLRRDISCRSAHGRRRWCWRSRSASRCSPACSSAPRPRGSRRGPIRSTRCAARAERRAIIRRSRARRCSSCRPRCRSSSSPARRCWPQPEQPRAAGLRLQRARPRPRRDQPAAGELHGAEAGGAVSRARGSAEPHARRAGRRLALYNPLTDNWGELILVAGHPPPKPGDDAGASWDRVSANYLQNLGMTMVRGRAFTAADNETTAPVAIVNEAFVKRFFKSDEDPIGQHFGLDLPENVGTFRSSASCATRSSRASRSGGRRGRCSTCRSRRTWTTEQRDEARRVPVALHRRADARDEAGAGRARAAGHEGAGGGRSEPDDHQRADDARSRSRCRSIRSARSRASRDSSAAWRCCSRRSACTA